MHLIIIAVVIVSVIGLIAGLGLAVASKVMAVPVDEKAEEIQAALPGANCGACGFSGCSGYASALSQGKTTDTGRCMPGGAEVSKAIAKITGLAAGDVVPMTAVVLCQGNMHNTDTKLNYVGVKSCKMATQLFGGPKECVYGCIGVIATVISWPSTAVAHRLLPGVRIVRLIAIFRYSAPIVRVCIPHKTRTYAIANSVKATPQSLALQGFENSVPKLRRQEVSRKTACKNEKTGKTGDFGLSEVRRYKRKTPQTLACSGVFVTVLDRVAPFYWRARSNANTNCLCCNRMVQND